MRDCLQTPHPHPNKHRAPIMEAERQNTLAALLSDLSLRTLELRRYL